ncbi:hypothetical protein NHX12_033845, partial [Muraenolepis orangiensis]
MESSAGSDTRSSPVGAGLWALGDADFPAVLRQLLPMMKPPEERPDSGGPGGPVEAEAPRRSGEECGPEEMILLLIFLYSLAEEAQP